MSDTPTFKLTIELGNAEMQTEENVAVALIGVADRLLAGTTGGAFIMDANGNTVGHWEMDRVAVEEEA